jgi:BlaI family penicillinase repressor
MAPRRSRNEGKPNRPPLGGLELEVMLVVWELGECTSGDVIAAFRRKRTLAPSTIRNVLAKLRAKGYVKPIPSIGRGFLLRPTVQRETFARRTLKSLLSSLFEGSPRQAIAYLLHDTAISDQELDEIRELIDARKRRGDRS